MAKVISNLVLLLGVLSISACSQIKALPELPKLEPWVAPYERGTLSREEMVRTRHLYPGKFREHVYSVRGAAQGATGAQGGGCGCN